MNKVIAKDEGKLEGVMRDYFGKLCGGILTPLRGIPVS